MSWDVFTPDWLVRAAGGGFVILALAALAVRRCQQPADRVRIAGLALVGAVLVPVVALIPGLPQLSLAVLPIEVAQAPVPEPAPAPLLPPVAVEDAPAFRPASEPTTSSVELKTPAPVPASAPSTSPTAEATQTVARAVQATEVITTLAPAPQSAFSVARVVLIGYGALTGAFLVWSLVGLWRLFLLWRSTREAPAEAVALLREIAGPAADSALVLISDRLESPVAFGGWRPIIVLPASAAGAEGRSALRYGLAHEWSHVERGDVWRWYLVTFAQVFLFYQPLFWWLRRQLRLSQDYLADARAVDQSADPVEYAEYLVTLARRRLGVPGLALGITDRRSNLTRRVHMLLLNRTPIARRCRLVWTCGAALLALGLVASVSAIRLTAGDAPAKSTDEKKPDDAKKPATPAKVEGETLNYTGKVTDKDTGKPIAGATVTVRRSILGDPEQKETNPVLEETKHTTDAQGKYSFVIPPEQTSKRYLYVELDVEHPDYAAQKGFGYALSMIRKNEKLGGRPFFESVEMRPAKPVNGIIKTPDGKPAAGVKVQAYSVTNKRANGAFEYGSFVDVRTDAEGKFRLPLTTPGWAVLWLLPEEFVPVTHVLKEKRGDLGTFTLQTGPRLRGTVLDAKGKPVVGAIINAESRDHNEEITEPVADNINRSAVTNAKGEFAMRPLPPGNYVVKPGDYQRDGALDRKDAKSIPVPEAVFAGTKVVLKAGADPERIEVRAVPHVTIEAQYLDSKGKQARGHSCHVFGEVDGVPWFGDAKADANGKVIARVPHGMENVQFNLMTNEHGSLRWRKAKGEELNNNRTIRLGTLSDDVKGIEIVRYTAPILTVKVVAKDGTKLVKPAVTAIYASGKGALDGRFILRNGRQSDVSFEEQEDGRFRSSQMFPDDELTISGHAEGYADKSEKVKLAEGATKEIEIVLEKAPAKPEEEKKK
ncbi:Peptidase M56 BlaR1 OS=Planctomyces brasiliensis (strain ATCC 49424 / DSM 5305 / JCM 21570 / NBRC 103401 / IFAM 1448) GN=Plabr_3892 PE=4 SV=1: Peptidase_M56: CarboxypepD_reg: CarboxypepD_reg [Gemmata massiliana]|uniref:Peptidase M56 domain-containing protein n=1 Tax=Gemmata massiliana TaxID=1210884 RepID=A0A6P2CX30_9BACT|nr:carboxypeptidase regulatory-like domain-containing protein [Gemmata massiliana]VTR93551.1 Peptidase M56 BlaR1 OS=Planctomyces brasiliensis (strain ATCC 49424 / DSM 5305 / JCM 21570 / NBRC 103401 / IFAM 1448) GN=Plabr_3892 PE=4 SV=1: Peptidase_M56: CarboxypepD_reg: CarboxypepD_reg [Gemmata massiliana]